MRGDLDWIVMKCLEKDRRAALRDGQRSGAGHPAASEQRAGGRPSAQPAYRFQKFVRRNKVAFAAAGAVAAALVLGIVGQHLAGIAGDEGL